MQARVCRCFCFRWRRIIFLNAKIIRQNSELSQIFFIFFEKNIIFSNKNPFFSVPAPQNVNLLGLTQFFHGSLHITCIWRGCKPRQQWRVRKSYYSKFCNYLYILCRYILCRELTPLKETLQQKHPLIRGNLEHCSCIDIFRIHYNPSSLDNLSPVWVAFWKGIEIFTHVSAATELNEK